MKNIFFQYLLFGFKNYFYKLFLSSVNKTNSYSSSGMELFEILFLKINLPNEAHHKLVS